MINLNKNILSVSSIDEYMHLILIKRKSLLLKFSTSCLNLQIYCDDSKCLCVCVCSKPKGFERRHREILGKLVCDSRSF